MELKKIIFRADGNSEVGLGHLSRLFSLVEMLKDKYKCFFLTKSDSFIEIIPKEYNVDIIPKNILFYEEPKITLWIGGFLIISSTTYIAWRESKLKK